MIQVPPFTSVLWGDTETRSRIGINRGSHTYAEGSVCTLFPYALDEGDVKLWSPMDGEAMPLELHHALANRQCQLKFHNIDFDRVQMRAWSWCKPYNLTPERFFCTMTQARSAGFPGALEALCAALGIPEQYSKKDGDKLIRLFCTPDTAGRFRDPKDYPREWAEFKLYAIFDVLAMRECMRRVPQTMGTQEIMYSAYTAIMNDRGLGVDTELVNAAIDISTHLKAKYKAEARDASGNFLYNEKVQEFNVTSQKAVMAFLKEYGVHLPDARSATLREFLNTPEAEALPPNLRKVLTTRLRVNKASVAKYDAVRKGASSDGVLRGTVAFRGAGRTGRDAGRRFQPQNLARAMLVGSRLLAKHVNTPALVGHKLSMEEACLLVKKGLVEAVFEDPMQVLSDCVRGIVVPRKGRKFCNADLSNIEGRKLVWLCNEAWKLQYFRDFDAGLVKFDNYVMAYAKAFGATPESVIADKENGGTQRQVGKCMELALGYQGWVGAFITFAAVYNIDLDALVAPTYQVTGELEWAATADRYQWAIENGMDYGLSVDTWTACVCIVTAWRKAHPAVVSGWKKAEQAFVNAVKYPGHPFEGARDTTLVVEGEFLFVRLPSGRLLTYPRPHVETKGRKPVLKFYAVNSFTKKFGLQYTHGGRLIENWTQASSNCVMMDSTPDIEDAGYPIVLRVHDEYLTEPVDSPEFTGQNLAKLMATPKRWYHDLPLAAQGEDLRRYG